MMTEVERAIVERELQEAERKGYQKALLDLQRHLNSQIDLVGTRYADTGTDFIQGVVEGLSIARTWCYLNSDF